MRRFARAELTEEMKRTASVDPDIAYAVRPFTRWKTIWAKHSSGCSARSRWEMKTDFCLSTIGVWRR